MERIALAREYRVAAWLRDALLELTQKRPLDFEEVRPAEPYFNSLDRNWEADVKKWEASIRDWETIARVFHLQTKVAASTKSFATSSHCLQCSEDYDGSWGGSSSKACLCKCHVLSMVDEAFRGELESLRENLGHVELPLPGMLPILVSYLCPLKTIFYSRQRLQHRQRSSQEEEGGKEPLMEFQLIQVCTFHSSTTAASARSK